MPKFHITIRFSSAASNTRSGDFADCTDSSDNSHRIGRSVLRLFFPARLPTGPFVPQRRFDSLARLAHTPKEAPAESQRMVNASTPIPATEFPAPTLLELPLEDAADLDSTVRIGDGYPLHLGPHIPLGSLRELGPYRLLHQLGSGGMGIVFEVEDIATGEHFALKILRPTLVMEPEAKLRFFREARAMASIGHQRIVPIIRVGEDRGLPFIAMPLLRGETLETRLHRAPELTLDEMVRIGFEMAEGLAAAHQQGLIHRDVKPANVWLEEPDASVRLLDLGLAREMKSDAPITTDGLIMGTPAYMSPEQARGEPLDARSDLFSLGSIFYQMTTGERPFESPLPIAILGKLENHHPTRVSAKNGSIPVPLSNLIMELLAKLPKDRPPSARDVMERIQRIDLHERPRVAYPYSVGFDDRSDPPTAEADEADEPADPWSLDRESWLLVALLTIASIAISIWYFALR